uniref:Ion channel n=1 Tax=Steinernema glaseri TaxID=37863 RepID=A0A1I7YUQ2_9BILA
MVSTLELPEAVRANAEADVESGTFQKRTAEDVRKTPPMRPNFLLIPPTPTPKIPRRVSFNDRVNHVDEDTTVFSFDENDTTNLDPTPILQPIVNEQSVRQQTLETLDGLFQSTPSPPRRVLHSRRPNVFQTVSIKHSHWGIRHIVLIGILVIYAALGGLVFYALEASTERQTILQQMESLDRLIYNLSTQILNLANSTELINSTTLHTDVEARVREYYKSMLKNEGIYHGSILQKTEQHMIKGKWTYESAVFYTMTVFSTIGYGTITCHTLAGKIATVLYAIVGIPLMLVVLSDIGRVLLGVFTRTYNRCRFMILRQKTKWKMKKGEDVQILRLKNYKAVTFPFYMTIVVVIVYLMICSIIVSFFDIRNGSFDGMSYANALYFSFISMSTIGFGDVMPAELIYNPLIQLIFLFGLALISVINSTLYESCEASFMRFVYRMEKWIVKVTMRKKTTYDTCGYNVFKNLSANIQLLAIAVPIFDEHEEEKIGNLLEPNEAIKLPHALAILSESLADIRPFRAIRSNSKMSDRGLGFRMETRKKRSMTVTAVPLDYHSSLDKQDSLDEHRKNRGMTVSALEVPFMPFHFLNKGYDGDDDSTTSGSLNGGLKSEPKTKKKAKPKSTYDLSRIVVKPRTLSDVV